MALNFNDQYPENSNPPTAEYPFGSFKNRSSPTSNDGTTLDAPWSNDLFTLHWKLLIEAGMIPNGEVDTVESSQYYEALIKVIQANVQKLTTSDKFDGVDRNKVATEYAVGEAYRRTVKRTGDTMTGALNMRNESIPANNTGAIVQFSNVQGVGTFTTKPETGNAQSIVHKLPSRAGILALGNTAVGADNGQLSDTVTGITFKWGEVNYTSYPGEITVRVTFNTPFDTACYNVQSTRKMNVHDFQGDGGVHLINKSRTGFIVSLQNYNNVSIAQLRGFSWLAIGK